MSISIVIVCRGNVARSPFAAAIVRQELALRGLDDCRVTSRGVQGTRLDPEPVKHPNITHYDNMYEGVKHLLEYLDIDLSNHCSTVIDDGSVREASIIVAMDQKTKMQLTELFPEAAKKIRLFSEISGRSFNVVDPETIASPKNQAEVFLGIRQELVGHFPQLLAMANGEY